MSNLTAVKRLSIHIKWASVDLYGPKSPFGWATWARNFRPLPPFLAGARVQQSSQAKSTRAEDLLCWPPVLLLSSSLLLLLRPLRSCAPPPSSESSRHVESNLKSFRRQTCTFNFSLSGGVTVEQRRAGNWSSIFTWARRTLTFILLALPCWCDSLGINQ